jgi:hypothetical protein
MIFCVLVNAGYWLPGRDNEVTPNLTLPNHLQRGDD